MSWRCCAAVVKKRQRRVQKAYTCLNLAWLLRGKYETLDPNDASLAEERKECKEQEEAFYAQAFEGLTKAVASEGITRSAAWMSARWITFWQRWHITLRNMTWRPSVSRASSSRQRRLRR